MIAEVCQWISNKSIEKAPDDDVVDGVPIRIRLLVALLKIHADQLFIDSSRVNLDMLETVGLPDKEFAHWWAFHYTQTLPIITARSAFILSSLQIKKNI